MNKTILILGACGQIGTELTLALRQKYGNESVVASDIRRSDLAELQDGPFEILDASDADALRAVCEQHKVHTVYHLVAMLSATGEKFPMKAWDLNMQSLLHVLELAREGVIQKIFWPSSIAVFGPTTPKEHTPQQTIMEPSTVYGISKLAGERWCEYYFNKYGVDVRSIRYPGLISWKSQPGGGTTDYAPQMIHAAVNNEQYVCRLSEQTILPFVSIYKTVSSINQLMDRDTINSALRVFNIQEASFSINDLYKVIQSKFSEFKIEYEIDFKFQSVADTWPSSLNCEEAKNKWDFSSSENVETFILKILNKMMDK